MLDKKITSVKLNCLHLKTSSLFSLMNSYLFSLKISNLRKFSSMKSLITFLTIFLCIPFPDTDDFFFCALSTPCVDFDTNCIIYNHWATLGYWHTSKIYCEIFENNNIFFFFYSKHSLLRSCLMISSTKHIFMSKLREGEEKSWDSPVWHTRFGWSWLWKYERKDFFKTNSERNGEF